MKISRELKSEIARWVRSRYGRTATIEVGTRSTSEDERSVSPNALLWIPGADLFDFVEWKNLKTIDDVPDLPGAATLDLYVYTNDRRLGSRELETNVYVTIADGRLADIHDHDLQSDARTFAVLGRPFSAPDPLEVRRAEEKKTTNDAKTYRVTIEEKRTTTRVATIEADSADDARAIVESMDWRSIDETETSTDSAIVDVEERTER